MKTNTTLPRLRFPEFREDKDWRSKKLSNLATFHKGKGISKADITENGSLPCIRYGELYTYYGEVIDKVISSTDVKRDNLVLSQANDVIIPASGETKEDISTASCVIKEGVALGGDLNIIRSKLNGVYLSYYLNSTKKREISQLAQGVSVIHLYSSQLGKLDIDYPSNKEQQKIADCLASLDTLLNAESRQLDTLQTYKAGLLQQLLPTEDEAVPKARFNGFKGDWDVTKLGELCNVFMCKRIFAKETNESGDIPFYKIGTIGGQPDSFISRKLFEEYKDKYNFPRTGEVLLTCSGTVGKTVVYDGRDAYYQDSNIVWLDNPKQKVINRLLYFIINNIDWSSLNSTTIKRIYGADLRELTIKYPNNEDEQQKIADCLSSVDTLIEAQARKIKTLKQHKQGLMQQLFPIQGEQ